MKRAEKGNCIKRKRTVHLKQVDENFISAKQISPQMFTRNLTFTSIGLEHYKTYLN